jgi:hypothetical protein
MHAEHHATTAAGVSGPLSDASASASFSPPLVVAAAAAVAKVAVHVPWLSEYGYHRDELYFIDCGAHLAFGYVDHAPLVPWLAWLAGALFEHDLFALRIVSVLAGALAAALTVLMARELSGGRLAQIIAGTCVIVAPAYLRMAKILSIPAIELLWWTLASYLVLLALHRAEPRRWLAVGAIAGIGLLTKHTMLLWGAGITVGIVLTPSARPQLRTRWPYLGLLIAFLLFAPNLLWQAQHDWATLEFVRNARHGTLARIPRALFVGRPVPVHAPAVRSDLDRRPRLPLSACQRALSPVRMDVRHGLRDTADDPSETVLPRSGVPHALCGRSRQGRRRDGQDACSAVQAAHAARRSSTTIGVTKRNSRTRKARNCGCPGTKLNRRHEDFQALRESWG